jgi:hypothetical protein
MASVPIHIICARLAKSDCTSLAVGCSATMLHEPGTRLATESVKAATNKDHANMPGKTAKPPHIEPPGMCCTCIAMEPLQSQAPHRNM